MRPWRGGEGSNTRAGSLFVFRQVDALFGELRWTFDEPSDSSFPLFRRQLRIEQRADPVDRLAFNFTGILLHRVTRLRHRRDLQAKLNEQADRVTAADLMRLGPGVDGRRQALGKLHGTDGASTRANRMVILADLRHDQSTQS